MKQYDSYKDSGVQWIGRIPSHWKVFPLKRCGKFNKGLTFTKADLVDEGCPVVSYGQIHSKNNTGTEIKHELIRFVPDFLVENGENSVVRQGDFIFADTSEDLEGSGNAVYVDKDVSLYGGYHTILLQTKNDDNKYLAYLFRTDCWRRQIRSRVSGVKVYSITQSILSLASVVLPPIPEQQAIATYLDKKCAEIDKAIATQQKRIELLQELRQNIITHAVTRGINPDVPLKDSGVEWIGMVPEHWEVMMLKRCATIKTGCTPPTKEEKYYEADDIDWFTPGDIGDDHIEEAEKKISDSAKRDGVCRIFPAKSVYFVGIGATIGKVSYCNIEASANQQINAIIPNKRATYKYITYCLKSQKEEVFLTANTVTLPIINQDRTGSLRIPVPPLKEQQAIVAYVEAEATKLDKLVAKANRQITLLQELKQSIITEVVTGKRKVC